MERFRIFVDLISLSFLIFQKEAIGLELRSSAKSKNVIVNDLEFTKCYLFVRLEITITDIFM